MYFRISTVMLTSTSAFHHIDKKWLKNRWMFLVISFYFPVGQVEQNVFSANFQFCQMTVKNVIKSFTQPIELQY
jgi:hypothetical protein